MAYRFFSLLSVLLLAACAGDSASPPFPPATGCVPSTEQQAMLEAVNRARAQARSCGGEQRPPVAALTWSCPLAAAAEGHAADMARYGLVSHTGSDGLGMVERVEAHGYRWSRLAENVAGGQSSVNDVMAGWLASPGHCRNIMDAEHRELGSARADSASGRYRHYWVQVFAAPR